MISDIFPNISSGFNYILLPTYEVPASQTTKAKNTGTVVKVYLGIETLVDRECNHGCKILQITNKLHWFQMRSCITSDG